MLYYWVLPNFNMKLNYWYLKLVKNREVNAHRQVGHMNTEQEASIESSRSCIETHKYRFISAGSLCWGSTTSTCSGTSSVRWLRNTSKSSSLARGTFGSGSRSSMASANSPTYRLALVRTLSTKLKSASFCSPQHNDTIKQGQMKRRIQHMEGTKLRDLLKCRTGEVITISLMSPMLISTAFNLRFATCCCRWTSKKNE